MSARIAVVCPACGKVLLFVSAETLGTLFPYCKVCRSQKQIELKKN